jgi:hypothetical protein
MAQTHNFKVSGAASTAVDAQTQTAAPWWKEPYVWMVISGPMSAVVACLITAVYILQGPDALVPDDQFDQGRHIALELKSAAPAMQPAHTARNHSATGAQSHAKP